MKLAMLTRLALLALLVTFIVTPETFAPVFAPFTQNNAPAIYTQSSILSLTLSHLALVGLATLAATLFSVSLAIIVTRPSVAAAVPPHSGCLRTAPENGSVAACHVHVLYLSRLIGPDST